MAPRLVTLMLLFIAGVAVCASSQSGAQVSEFTNTHFHLAPRRSAAKPITEAAMLAMLDGLCRFDLQFQDKTGAIIDPYMHRDFQYATPYFAFAIGTLVEAGRSRELLPNGIAAMESATRQIGGGLKAIPDGHSEFFLASLSEALPVYELLVPRAQWERWRDRMKLPIGQIYGLTHNSNWRTYGMKGEWKRAKLGLVPRAEALDFIEGYWDREQRARFSAPPTRLYHDLSSDPDTLSVALVGEGNLLSLVLDGYDGPSAEEIRTKVLDSLRTTVFLADPTGQVPANGRTDDHVWTEVGMQLAFSAAAPLIRAEGDNRTADAMERTAELSFGGMQRWRRTDGKWSGSYFITKNHFDPALRIGYQNASQVSNYTGSLMFHLAEMYRIRHDSKPATPVDPAPAEIGGYTLALDPLFSAAFANAGGLQMAFNLRGETAETNDNWWTPLGGVRIARAAWETRLGPSDGAQTANDGLTFAPEFRQDGKWVRLAALSAAYRGTWSVQSVNPAMVRCMVEYRPVDGYAGPVFRNRFVLTPDGVLSSVEQISPQATPWGVTWPLLVNDGTALMTNLSERLAETSYPGGSDVESFLAVDASGRLDSGEPTMRSTYGDLLPIRLTVETGTSHTFVYPHDRSQPASAAVLKSFQLTPDGFTSVLGSVKGDVYISPSYAGGHAKFVDRGGPLEAAVTFDHECGFVAQLEGGRVRAIETDQPVTLRLGEHTYRLSAYTPLRLP